MLYLDWRRAEGNKLAEISLPIHTSPDVGCLHFSFSMYTKASFQVSSQPLTLFFPHVSGSSIGFICFPQINFLTSSNAMVTAWSKPSSYDKAWSDQQVPLPVGIRMITIKSTSVNEPSSPPSNYSSFVAIKEISLVDEACSFPVCRPNEFRCDSGQCVDKHFECDGYVDCLDESDELHCRELLLTPYAR